MTRRKKFILFGASQIALFAGFGVVVLVTQGTWFLLVVAGIQVAILGTGLVMVDWKGLQERVDRHKIVVDSYEAVLARCLTSGKMVIGNRRDDGKWEVEELPADQPKTINP